MLVLLVYCNMISDEERLERFLKEIRNNPGRYAAVSNSLHQWALDHISEASGMLERIPESLRDGLADAVIDVYSEKKEKEGG